MAGTYRSQNNPQFIILSSYSVGRSDGAQVTWPGGLKQLSHPISQHLSLLDNSKAPWVMTFLVDGTIKKKKQVFCPNVPTYTHLYLKLVTGPCQIPSPSQRATASILCMADFLPL